METLDGHFVAVQIQGQRDSQEDEYGLLETRRDAGDSEHTVIAVADGMGGHIGGARASSLVTETFIDTYQQFDGLPVTERLKMSLDSAHAALLKEINENPDYEGMGTTLVCAVIEEDDEARKSLSWLSVGDSLLYLFRGGSLTRLNADHSMAPVLEELVRKGKMSPEAAARDPNRHGLLSAVSGDKIDLLDLPDSPLALEEGDLLLLASDGILTLNEERIAGLLSEHATASLQEKAQSLVREIERQNRPGQDNVTIALYAPFVSPLVTKPEAGTPPDTDPSEANDSPEDADISNGDDNAGAKAAFGLSDKRLLIGAGVLLVIALLLLL